MRAPQFQYFNHVSDCSVQCTNGTRSPEMTIYEVHVCNTGCHGHAESVGVSVSVLCSMMTMQLLRICGQCFWNWNINTYVFTYNPVLSTSLRCNNAVLLAWMCSHFRVSSLVRTLHTATTHLIIALELHSLTCHTVQLEFMWAPQFQCFNHVSDCSVQCTNRTRNRITTVYSTYEVRTHF